MIKKYSNVLATYAVITAAWAINDCYGVFISQNFLGSATVAFSFLFGN